MSGPRMPDPAAAGLQGINHRLERHGEKHEIQLEPHDEDRNSMAKPEVIAQ